MLLKYRTYLLYDVSIELKSGKAFKAINNFLANVKGNISHKFFRWVDISIGKSSVNLYNQFIKQYLSKGFNIEKLYIEEKDSLKNMKI